MTRVFNPRPAALIAVALALSLAGCAVYPDWVYVSQRPTGATAAPAPPPQPAPQPGSVQGAAAPQAASTVAPSLAQPAPAGRVRVEPGDTLYSIARAHDVAVRDLIAVNELAPPYTLLVGQLLALPATRYHTVEKGDTVYNIAQRYGVDMSTLVRLNGIEPPYTITVGQRLQLPSSIRLALVEAAGAPGPSGGAIEVTALEAPPGTAPPGAAATPAEEGNPAAAEVGEPVPGATSPALQAGVERSPIALADLGPAAATGGRFEWPAQGPVTSSFGPKAGNLHNDGINIALAKGTPVRAVADGVVAYVGNELRGYGNLVLIRHPDGWVSAYAHNDALLVSRGQQVHRGDVVALSGDTGGVAKPQLHFELRRNGVALDPLQYLGKG